MLSTAFKMLSNCLWCSAFSTEAAVEMWTFDALPLTPVHNVIYKEKCILEITYTIPYTIGAATFIHTNKYLHV